MNYSNWYAVSINMNKERSCREQLLARRAVAKDPNLLEVEYLQKKELVFDKGGKKKIVTRLLMSGYLLVQVNPEITENEDGSTTKSVPGETFKLITETNGVREFVNCDKDRPIPFRPSEIKKMFEMCDDAHLEAKLNIEADFVEGDILEVIQGPFKGYDIEVIGLTGDKILGQLDMFGRTIPAEFTKTQVYKK